MRIGEFLGLFKEGKVGAKSHMKNLIEMAMADGHFDDIEDSLLKKIAKKHKVSEKMLREIKNQPDQIEFEVPGDQDLKFEYLFDLVHMMVVDNFIDKEEITLCEVFAKKFGYKESNAKELIDSVATNILNNQSIKETKKRVEWLF